MAAVRVPSTAVHSVCDRCNILRAVSAPDKSCCSKHVLLRVLLLLLLLLLLLRVTYWGKKSHLSDSGVHMPVGYGSQPEGGRGGGQHTHRHHTPDE
jgi:hypothetical protein